MKIINLTPHAVNIINEDGKQITSFPSAGVVRASQREKHIEDLTVDGGTVEIVSVEFGAVSGLPAPEDGVRYIVSTIAANAARAEGRSTEDLLITLNPVRAADGSIIGCRKLAKV